MSIKFKHLIWKWLCRIALSRTLLIVSILSLTLLARDLFVVFLSQSVGLNLAIHFSNRAMALYISVILYLIFRVLNKRFNFVVDTGSAINLDSLQKIKTQKIA